MDREQVPLLGDVPVVGAAFRGQDDAVERLEIIFLLTPSIIEDERLWEMGEDGLEILDAVRLGARAGLLPFSRDQITSDYNRDAIEAYRDGEVDLALYYANNSLRTSSLQPEMVRLRDTLARSHRTSWERSIQRRLLDQELELVPPGDLTPEPAADAPALDASTLIDGTTSDTDLSSLSPTGDNQGFGADTPASAAADEK